MGAATAELLASDGWLVIGVDVRDADVVADLSSRQGRAAAVDHITSISNGTLDAVATFAGISAFTGAEGDTVTSVNYFGTVALMETLRPLLARGDRAAAMAVSSNTATTAPGIDEETVESCLAGDEQRACERSLQIGPAGAYAASKFAVARWARRRAPTDDWAGAGIMLNVLVPGMVDTPMTEAMRHHPDAAPMLEKLPLPAGRAAAPAEIATVTRFLLAPSTRFIVGSLIFADGGTDAVIRPDDWPSRRVSRRPQAGDPGASRRVQR
jgi:NAD(P)-dependent dehydrogenase (short-subunit alcohol dehydrogenase family)